MRCFLSPVVLACLTGLAAGIDDRAMSPNTALGRASHDRLELGNRVIRCVWQTDEGHIGSLAVTNLQELHISPSLLTPTMWDELAAAAKWSRANADVLIDTHWIGGDPGSGDIYGWASWQPRGGIVVLRNPSAKPGTYELELARDLELPDQQLTNYQLKSPRPNQRIGQFRAAAVELRRIELQPFEVLVFKAVAVVEAEKDP